MALRAIGITGLVLAVVLRVVLTEPPRRPSLLDDQKSAPTDDPLDPDAPRLAERREASTTTTTTTLKETVGHVIRMRSFWLLAISAGARQLGGVVFGYYMPSYLQQLYPHVPNLTSTYGIIVGAVGSSAVLAGGLYCALHWHRSVLTPLYLTACGGMISSIFVILMVFSRQIAGDDEIRGARVLYGVMSLAYVTAELWLGAFNTLFVFLLPPRYKTFALAIYMSVVVFIYSSGPAIVGLALRQTAPTSPTYLRDVRIVLAVIIPSAYWIAGIGFLSAIPLVRQDLTKPKSSLARVSSRRKLGLSTGLTFLGAMVLALFVTSIVLR